VAQWISFCAESRRIHDEPESGDVILVEEAAAWVKECGVEVSYFAGSGVSSPLTPLQRCALFVNTVI
jgi:hypothetical protein